MQYYTVVGDSYDEAVRKAREMYGNEIRIHSRRDYTTRGGFFTRKKTRCEIVCYLGKSEYKDEKVNDTDIAEFEKEAKTPDPSTLPPEERLNTEIYRTKHVNPEAALLLDLNHITDPLRAKLLEDFPEEGDVSVILSSRLLEAVTFDYSKQLHPRRFVVFIGPTGSGKTTTLAKAAYLFSHSDRSVGIITLEDLLEEIVGNIYDEFDPQEEAEITKIGDGVWKVSGSLLLSDFSDETGIEIEENEDYDTIGGMVLSTLSQIPEDGTELNVTVNGLRIHVTKIEDRRIEEAIVEKADESETDRSEEGSKEETAKDTEAE